MFNNPSISMNVESFVTLVLTNNFFNPTWLTLYMEYLIQGILLPNKDEAKKLMVKSKNYVLLQDKL